MLRFNRLACVLLVCGCVAIAYAKVVKILSFAPVGVVGEDENPDVDGVAIMNFQTGLNRTHVQIAMTDLLPDTDYIAFVRPDDLFDAGNVAFTTNPAGNGQGQTQAIGDLCDLGSFIRVDILHEAADGSGELVLVAEGSSNCP